MYARKSSYKRTYRRRSGGVKSSGGLARKAMSSVRSLRRMVKPEYKQIIEPIASTSLTTAGTVYTNFNDIAQGTGYDQRIGLNVQCKSLAFDFTHVASVAAGACGIRFIFFIDKQQVNATTPAVTEVLEYANVDSPYSHATKGRFKILKDLRFNNDPVQKTLNDVRGYIKLNHRIQWSATTSATLQKGNVYMLVIGAVPSYASTFSGYMKTSYTDL